ncbi:MAG: NAD-dependent epimerase/dehydratase family protein [Rikenellaceae bacterium]|nr:NAD-dependent epimerase/dehydratase family protein [Rikenellaceae bacterium]
MEQRRGLKDKKILVTGSTGMLGRELIRQLTAEGIKPVLIVRNRSSLDKLYKYLGQYPEFTVFETELINPIELTKALRGIDLVFHCAAEVSMNDGTDNLVVLNTDITSHVVNACIDAGVGKLVHVSSVAAIGSVKGRITDEKLYPESLAGWTPYAVSKFYSENEVWRGHRMGLDTVIVNPSVIFGTGSWKEYGTPLLFHVLTKGISIYPTGGTGFVDCRDVASAMILLAETPQAVGRRFILNSENILYKDLITLIAEVMGNKPPRYKVGDKILNLLSSLSGVMFKALGRENILSKNIAELATSRTLYDSSAVTELTGFQFRPVRETIEYMAKEYIKDNHR